MDRIYMKMKDILWQQSFSSLLSRFMILVSENIGEGGGGFKFKKKEDEMWVK